MTRRLDKLGPRENPPSCWTERRLRILKGLQQDATPLAELYETAVILLYLVNLPGRARLVAHSVREIGNRLADYREGPAGGTRIDYPKRLDRIAKVWRVIPPPEQNPFPDDSPTAQTAIPTMPLVILPARAAREVTQLLEDHAKSVVPRSERVRRLFAGAEPSNLPVINSWANSIDWFLRFVHVGQDVVCPGDEEITIHFELFEAGLWTLYGTLTETLDELDEILDKANS